MPTRLRDQVSRGMSLSKTWAQLFGGNLLLMEQIISRDIWMGKSAWLKIYVRHRPWVISVFLYVFATLV